LISHRFSDTTSYSEEIKQIHVRTIFIITIYLSVYLLADVLSGPFPNHLDYGQLFLLSLLYVIPAGLHAYFVKHYPATFVWARRIFIMLLDLTYTTLLLYYLNPLGTVYSPLYLWIVMGNGMRYGRKIFFVAMGIALFCLALLTFISPYWNNNINVVYGLAVAIILLPLFYLRLMSRLTEKNRELEKLLRLTDYQAKYDTLTAIPNRQMYEKSMEMYLEKGESFALFFIDLDGFKDINDNFGHQVGDLVLKEVSERIKPLIRKKDMIARLGGDEFVLIRRLPDPHLEDFAAKLLSVISDPYHVGTLDLSLSASIGISICPDDASDELHLNSYADQAMYHAKKTGKNRYLFYRQLQFLERNDGKVSSHPGIAAL